ncbi:hypothetical protein L195_g032461 [Trifolium pratense]|uniref:Uncharacterized protein n=1 Tax=Trifolium pratense TaxID=57577 RepID=A0A2K3LDB3_TRIPR|nr:hypothetical protein L195_g032461 [Trifolium pratense]
MLEKNHVASTSFLPFISTSLPLLPLSLATATATTTSYFLSQRRSSSLFLLTPPQHHELAALSSSLHVFILKLSLWINRSILMESEKMRMKNLESGA